MVKLKRKSRIWIGLRNGFLVTVTVFTLWMILSNIMTAYEQKSYPPKGELLEVDGKQMHVYTKGEGDNTIVLLSGLGTAAPTLDFEPLVNEMAKDNKVVVVELFGYGWSENTNKERTVKNIVGEIRTALKKANIPGPYILMPHSISGIYSMYFAYTYPEEVKAVIGIDPTLPKELDYFGESLPAMPKFLSLVSPTGLARLAVLINSKGFLPIAEEATYSKENLEMTKAISAWKSYNISIINEANELKNNIKKTTAMSFPSHMPVLLFTTTNGKVTEDGKNNITFYETQLTNSPSSKIIQLQGHHYLHWTRYKQISKDVKDFIASINTVQ
ncbi:alpha/beta fold hydrolase [Niallia taxi]|uniref:alpha/beta fold hydrolase n=1 Tax=Niallia taxi TaxID=2499688 RepID=UPI0021A2DF40|nr:alpha/beta hydrolase [Niallia taxi]MCT2347282.1 alpha/beta hydrolase [Niallia taxi]MED3961506.1 alpha/beta hydrolase [Niallia taxi]